MREIEAGGPRRQQPHVGGAGEDAAGRALRPRAGVRAGGGPTSTRMLEDGDAALVIGDPALPRRPRRRYRILDLAGEWREMTGYPASSRCGRCVRTSTCPNPTHLPEEQPALRALLDAPSWSPQSAAALPPPPGGGRGLPDAEPDIIPCATRSLASLKEYYRRAHLHGLIEKAPRGSSFGRRSGRRPCRPVDAAAPTDANHGHGRHRGRPLRTDMNRRRSPPSPAGAACPSPAARSARRTSRA